MRHFAVWSLATALVCLSSLVDAATITAITPNRGSVLGQTRVTVSGTGFDIRGRSNDVFIGTGLDGTFCDPVPNDCAENRIVCLTDPHEGAGKMPLSVRSFNFLATCFVASGCTFEYTQEQTPEVTGITPEWVTAGDEITVSGARFSNGDVTVAKFDFTMHLGEEERCELQGDVSWSSFVCKTYSMRPGTLPVDIIMGASGRASIPPGYRTIMMFPTVTDVSPSAGSIAGGTEVTITGTSFHDQVLAENVVTVHGAPCIPIRATNDRIVCVTTPRDETATAANAWTPSAAKLEQWNDLPGGELVKDWMAKANYLQPSRTVTVPSFSMDGYYCVNCAIRLTTYFVPAESGNYTFNMTGDDQWEFWLSADDKPVARRQEVPANSSAVLDITPFHSRRIGASTYSVRQVKLVELVAGVKYWLRGYVKQGGGGMDLSMKVGAPSGAIIPLTGANIAWRKDWMSPIQVTVKRVPALAGEACLAWAACNFNYLLTSTPSVTSVTPASAVPGDLVTIQGAGFDTSATKPAAAAACAPVTTCGLGGCNCPNAYMCSQNADYCTWNGLTGKCDFTSVPSCDTWSLNNVTIGDAPCFVSVQSATSLTCRLGFGTQGTYPVAVFVAMKGQASGFATLAVTGAIRALFPTAGSVNGANSLTIVGRGFDALAQSLTTVSVGGSNCPVTKVEGGRVLCTLSGGAAGAASVALTTGSRTAVAIPYGFSYAVPDVRPGTADTAAEPSIAPLVSAVSGDTLMTITVPQIDIVPTSTVDVFFGSRRCAVRFALSHTIRCSSSATGVVATLAADVTVTHADGIVQRATTPKVSFVNQVTWISTFAASEVGGNFYTIYLNAMSVAPNRVSVALMGQKCTNMEYRTTSINCWFGALPATLPPLPVLDTLTFSGDGNALTNPLSRMDYTTGVTPNGDGSVFIPAGANYLMTKKSFQRPFVFRAKVKGSKEVTEGKDPVPVSIRACVTQNSLSYSGARGIAGVNDKGKFGYGSNGNVQTTTASQLTPPYDTVGVDSTRSLEYRLEVYNRYVRFYIENTLIGSWEDTTCVAGSVGFGFNGQDVTVQSFTVENLYPRTLQVNLSSSPVYNPFDIMYSEGPVLRSISPKDVTETSAITIMGSNFGGGPYDLYALKADGDVINARTPKLCTGEARYNPVSSEMYIVCTVGAGVPSGAYVAALRTGSGQSKVTIPAVTVGARIKKVLPALGGTGGQLITLQGTNFAAGLKVTVGGTDCAPILSFSTTRVMCVAPGLALGQQPVALIINGETSTCPTCNINYANTSGVITSVAPTTITTGQSLTIIGTGFGASPTVYAGDAACGVWYATATEVRCELYRSVTAGSVKVILAFADNGIATGAQSVTIASGVASISPTTGSSSGGGTITVRGGNFDTSKGATPVVAATFDGKTSPADDGWNLDRGFYECGATLLYGPFWREAVTRNFTGLAAHGALRVTYSGIQEDNDMFAIVDGSSYHLQTGKCYGDVCGNADSRDCSFEGSFLIPHTSSMATLSFSGYWGGMWGLKSFSIELLSGLADYSVKVGGAACDVDLVDTNSIRCAAPAGTAEQAVEATVAGATVACASCKYKYDATATPSFSMAALVGLPGLNQSWTRVPQFAHTSRIAVTYSNMGAAARRVSSRSNWDGGVSSPQSLKAADGSIVGVSFKVSGRCNQMIGLTTDMVNSESYSDIDYALYFQRDGNIIVYENGQWITNVGNYVAGDTAAVAYNAACDCVQYTIRGRIAYTSARAPMWPLFADASIYDSQCGFDNMWYLADRAETRRVVLAGAGLIPGAGTVSLNGNACVDYFLTNGQVSCWVSPATASALGGSVSVTVRNPNGVGSSTGVPVKSVVTSAPQSAKGSTAGGHDLRFIGSGFTATTAVMVANVACPVTSFSESELVCRTAAAAASSGPVTVTTAGAAHDCITNLNLYAAASTTGCQNVQYAFDAAVTPTVTAISPASPSTGVLLAINGTGFPDDTPEIWVGSTACKVESVDDIVLTCWVGVLAAGTPTIAVRFPTVGLASNSVTSPSVAATITALSTTSMGSLGGSYLYVTGSGFGSTSDSAAVTVKVGGNAICAAITRSDTLLGCKTLAGSFSGNVEVSVNGAVATSAAAVTASDANTPKVTSVSPAMGGRNTIVTVTGTNLAGDGVVTFGTEPNLVTCPYTAGTATSATCRISGGLAAAASVPMGVSSVNGGTGSATSTFAFLLSVASVSPSKARQGDNVTVLGSGFVTGKMQVTISGAPCPIVAETASSLTCTLGWAVGAVSRFDVMVAIIDAANTATINSPQQYTYNTALTATVTSITPTSGSAAGLTQVTIAGTGFSTDMLENTVLLGSIPCLITVSYAELIVCTPEPTTLRGSQPVNVLISNQGKATTSSTYSVSFSVDTLSTPADVSVEGGAMVTVTGSGFVPFNAGDWQASKFQGWFGDRPCTVISATATTLTCRLAAAKRPFVKLAPLISAYPMKPEASGLLFSLKGNGVSATVAPTILINYKQTSTPRIATVAPSGVVTPGTAITIDGTNFAATGNVVTAAGSTCTVTSESTTHIVCTVTGSELGAGFVNVNVPGVGLSMTDKSCPAGQFLMCDGQCVQATNCKYEEWGMTTCPDLANLIVGDTFCHSNGGTDRVGIAFRTDDRTVFNMNCPMYSCEGGDCDQSLSIGGVGGRVSTCGLDPSGVAIEVRPSVSSLSAATSALGGARRITITGQKFGVNASEVVVKVDDAICAVMNVTDTSIICDTGAHIAQDNRQLQVLIRRQAAVCTGSCAFSYSATETAAITKVEPTYVVAGQLVTITGTKFGTDQASVAVWIGSGECTNVKLTAATAPATSSIVCTVPHQPAGMANLKVVRTNIGASMPSIVTYTLRVTGLSSNAGSMLGGSIVTVSGSGFTADTRVWFGSCSSAYSSFTNNTIIVTTNPCNGSVQAIAAEGATKSSCAGSCGFNFDASSTPMITASQVTGNNVVLTMTNLGTVVKDDVVVRAGDATCAISSYSKDGLTCTMSNGLGGKYNVSARIGALGYASPANPVQIDFPISIASVTPTSGSRGGGQSLTVMGSGFTTDASLLRVTIGTANCVVTSAVFDKIICLTGQIDAETTAKVTVGVVDARAVAAPTAAQSAADYMYANAKTPVVTSVAPARGSTAGGTTLTIAGSNLNKNMVVKIDGRVCTQSAAQQTATDGAAGSRLFCTTAVGRTRLEPDRLIVSTSTGDGDAYTTSTYQYIDLWSSWTTWGNTPPPVEGDSVVVSEGQVVVVDYSPPRFFLIIVMGHLKFDDNVDINFDCTYIMINFGRFTVGTPEKPYTKKATITLWGDRLTPEIPVHGAKVIALRHGALDMHGIVRQKTWTLLSATAPAASGAVSVRGPVDWKTGEFIVVTSTDYYYDHAEVRRIVGVSPADGQAATVTIQLEYPLMYQHFGERQCFGETNPVCIDEIAEVGLLTRNIVVRGDRDSMRLGFGGTMFLMPLGESTDRYARISYVEFSQVGQMFIVGRYPVHYHVTGSSNNSYCNGTAVHESMNRAFSIHGINNNTYVNNVAYDILGHAFFIEDGSERFNRIENNLVANVRSTTSNLNTDVTPANFWTVSPTNWIVGNRAGGGDAYGFWISPFHPHSTGPTHSDDVCPASHPLWKFEDNVAHSNRKYGLNIFQFWWPKQKECDFNGPDAQAVIRNHFSYKNQIWGVTLGNHEVGQVGSVIFENLMSADNGRIHPDAANYWIEKIKATNMTNGVRGAVLVALSNNQPENRQTSRRGINLPLGDNFFSENVTFVNYKNENHGYEPQAWAQRMSLCFPWGWEAVSRNLRWIDSPNRILFRFHHHGVLNDDDGTLTGEAGSQIVPMAPIFDPAICRTAAAPVGTNVPSLICPQPYKIRRFGIAQMSDIWKDQIWTIRNRSEVVPQILREYLMTAPVNNSVTLDFQHWKSPEQYNWGFGGPTFTQPFEWQRFGYMHNETRNRVQAKFNDLAGSKCQAEIVTVDNTNKSSCSFDNITNQFWGIIRRPTTSMAVSAFNCPAEGCPRKPRQPGAWDCNCNLYSESKSWLSGIVPPQNEKLVVQGKECICLDAGAIVPASSRQQGACAAGKVYELKWPWLEVNGGLHFRNEHCPCDGAVVHITIGANIWIRDGGIVVGNVTNPLSRCTFRISVSEPPFGDRLMGNFKLNPWGFRSVSMEAGMLALHGAAPQPMFTRLAVPAAAGATSITLLHEVNWTVGTLIVVAGTNRNVFLREPMKYQDVSKEGTEQSEKAEIAAVSGDKRTLTLKAALRFAHIGESTPQSFGSQSFYIGAEVAPLSRNIILDAGLPADPPNNSPTFGMGFTVNVGCTPTNREGCAVGQRGEVGWPMSEEKPGFVELEGVLFRDIGQEASTFGAIDVDGLSDGVDATWSYIRNNAFDRSYSTAIFVRDTTSRLRVENNVFFNYTNDAVRVAGWGNEVNNNLAFYQGIPINCDKIHFIFWDCRPAAFRVRSNNRVVGNIAASGVGAGFITEGEACNDEPASWVNNTAHSFREGVLVHTHIDDLNMKWNNSGLPSKCRRVGGVTTYFIADHGLIVWYADGNLIVENFTSVDSQIGSAAILLYPATTEGAAPFATYKDVTYAGYFNGHTCRGDRQYVCKSSLMDGAPWCKLFLLSGNNPAMGNMGMIETLFTGNNFGIGKTKGEQKFRWLEMDSYATVAGQVLVSGVHFANFDGKDTCGRKNVAFAQNIFSNDTFHHHGFEKVTYSGYMSNGGEFYGRRAYGDTNMPADAKTPTWYLDFDNFKFGAYWPDSPYKTILIDRDGSLLKTNKIGSIVVSETLTRPVEFQKIRYHGRGFAPGLLPAPLDGCVWNNDWNAYKCDERFEWVNVAIDNLDEDSLTRRPGPLVLCKGDGMIERNGDPKCQGLGADYASGPVMKGKEQRVTLDRMTRYRLIAENNQNYTLSFRGSPPTHMRLWFQNSEYLQKSSGIVINLRYHGLNSQLRVGVYVNGTRLRPNVGFGYPFEQTPAQQWPVPSATSGTHYHDKYVNASDGPTGMQRNVISFVLRPYDIVELKQEPIVQINMQLSMPVDEFFNNKETFVAAMASSLGIDENRLKFAKIVPGNPLPASRRQAGKSTNGAAISVDVERASNAQSTSTTGDLPAVLASSYEIKNGTRKVARYEAQLQVESAYLMTVQTERPTQLPTYGTPYISLNLTQSEKGVAVNRTAIRSLLYAFIKALPDYNSTEEDQYALSRVYYDASTDQTEGLILAFNDNSTLAMLALRDIFFPPLNSSTVGGGGVLPGYGVYDVQFFLNGWGPNRPPSIDGTLVKFAIGAAIGLFIILCIGGGVLFYFIRVKPRREAALAAKAMEPTSPPTAIHEPEHITIKASEQL